MIKVKENRQQHGERYRQEYVPDIHIPEINKPAAAESREKSLARGQCFNRYVFHMANVYESRKKHDCKWSAVVLDEFSDISLEEIAFADHATYVGAHEHEKGYHDGKVGRGFARFSPLTCEDLNPLLQVDKCHVESEDIAGETGDICQCIARIGNSKDPMHYHRPSRTVLIYGSMQDTRFHVIYGSCR